MFMQSDIQTAPASKAMFWTGLVMSVVPSIFLLMDGVMKLFKPDFVVKATVELGYPEGVIVGLGIVLVVSTIFYLFPPTAVPGAIRLPAFRAGPVPTLVRWGQGPFPAPSRSLSSA